ncbi:MAG: hypothetical protein OXL68_11360 [Paracoccaceae bacterium]|nr:hypothetical protein [Paracoccaceae bacterium]
MLVSVVAAVTPLNFHLDETVPMSITVLGGRITACAGNALLMANSDRAGQLATGGASLLVADGAVTVDRTLVSSTDSVHEIRTPPPARR